LRAVRAYMPNGSERQLSACPRQTWVTPQPSEYGRMGHPCTPAHLGVKYPVTKMPPTSSAATTCQESTRRR